MRFARHLVALLFTVFCGACLQHHLVRMQITYGFIDTNNTYSNVGRLLVKSPSTGTSFDLFGTLIAPNVFLTATTALPSNTKTWRHLDMRPMQASTVNTVW